MNTYAFFVGYVVLIVVTCAAFLFCLILDACE